VFIDFKAKYYHNLKIFTINIRYYMSKKRKRSAIFKDDRVQVLFNDGSNIGSNKRYRYADFAFEHINNVSSVCEETRGLWRKFGEKLGMSSGATKATFRTEFNNENYVLRTSFYLGDLLGYLDEREHGELGAEFLKLFAKNSEIGNENGQKVEVAIISNVTIRKILLG